MNTKRFNPVALAAMTLIGAASTAKGMYFDFSGEEHGINGLGIGDGNDETAAAGGTKDGAADSATVMAGKQPDGTVDDGVGKPLGSTIDDTIDGAGSKVALVAAAQTTDMAVGQLNA